MTLEETISKVRNLRDFENLKEILGKELGQTIYDLINKAERVDKELTVVHNCLTELYNFDVNIELIKSTLDEIESMYTPPPPPTPAPLPCPQGGGPLPPALPAQIGIGSRVWIVAWIKRFCILNHIKGLIVIRTRWAI